VGKIDYKDTEVQRRKEFDKINSGGGGKMVDLGGMGERANLGEVRECGVISCVL